MLKHGPFVLFSRHAQTHLLCPSGASANVLVENITMLRSDQVASIPDATRESLSIGTMDVQLNISDNSYLQVQGH